ncbi:MAG: hypothetical protein ACI85O_001731 [Saprospiraceae bacterium]|jgi:hypothetical protein
MSKTLFMFRNNYHPVFVMGFVGFVAGIFFLCISGILYNKFIDSFFLFPYPGIDPNSLTQEIWRFFIGTLTVGLTFVIASIGIMRKNKIARNIVTGLKEREKNRFRI